MVLDSFEIMKQISQLSFGKLQVGSQYFEKNIESGDPMGQDNWESLIA